MQYFAVFVPGMEDVVAGIINERLSDVKIIKRLDGAVLFETDCTYDRLNFFCFNNIFAVIDIQEQMSGRDFYGAEFPEFHMRKILNSAQNAGRNAISKNSIISENNKKIKSFRMIFSVENKPVSINEKTRQTIEELISHNSSLRTDRGRPDTEFWFLYRREGFSVFMKRLTNNRIGEKTLHQGELSPQIAYLLCHIAALKHGETTADPFCGYGSIVIAASKYFHITKMYACDIDAKCINITKSKKGLDERCQIIQTDFRNMKKFLPEKIDSIVTDPPWGLYDSGIPVQKFYNEMTEVFSEMLKDEGRAVILTAAITELEAAMENHKAFTLEKTIPVLVSGKKARVYLLKKQMLHNNFNTQ